MKRQVRIFVEGRQLDLFNDESIEVTSTIQNVQDISKTFTDFSQSFTIPTSPRNNAVWQYFYENAINSSINYQERLDGYIEIDMTFFRRGKIQMEKSQLKNGQPNSYTVTFYGSITTLKDIFGEDLLSNLDYTTLNHDYTFTEVFNRVVDASTDYDVCYPLISSNRIWEYGPLFPNGNIPNWLGSIGGNDITNNLGAIVYTELFPAVRVASIFQIIEQTYGVNFTGAFLTDPKFTQAYLWYKNRNQFVFTSEAQDIALSSFIGGGGYGLYNLLPYVDIATSSVNLTYLGGVNWHGVSLAVNTISNPAITYYIDVYRNGNLFATWTCLNTTIGGNLGFITNTQGLNDTYTFQIRSSAPLSVDFVLTYGVSYFIGMTPQNDFVQYSTNTNNLTTFTDLANSAPLMKINDFIAGILKEFNLTCFATGVNTFEIIPLQDWYASGAVVDITEFTDKTEIGVDRVKLYKKIAFKYQQSNSFMNKAFFDQALREYGNTEYQYPYDGGEYTIEVPFENLLFNPFVDHDIPTGLQVGYSLDNAFAPYIPKPCILYKFGGVNLVQDFKLSDGTNPPTATNDYVMFGQDLQVMGVDYSTNFAPETSTHWLTAINQSLFATYYFPYLTNLFNAKNRLTTIKANLPVSLLTGLQLNDRLIIRDKRYLINQMKTNMTTGETTFELLNDFMPIEPIKIIQVGEAEDDGLIGVSLPNTALKAMFSSTQTDVFIDPVMIESSQQIYVRFSADPTTTIDVTYLFPNGDTQDDQIIIVKI